MSELQKIAVGLLGISHPEIYLSRTASLDPAPSTVEAPVWRSNRGSKPTPAAAALSALKFALAALLAGARSIPLGDNGRVTRELGEYGAHLNCR
jgi:hypothetical protein